MRRQVLYFNDLVGPFLLPKIRVWKVLDHIAPLVLDIVLVIDLNSTEVRFPMGAASFWKRHWTLPH